MGRNKQNKTKDRTDESKTETKTGTKEDRKEKRKDERQTTTPRVREKERRTVLLLAPLLIPFFSVRPLQIRRAVGT